MSDKAKDEFTDKLRRFVETVDVANELTEPLARSIENLLRLSAREINSSEASVLIRDGDEGDLRFLSAIGEVADQLRNLRVPAGKGIAGFVFSSGQPMAVSDVGEEDAFYAEVDRETGYSTQMILATPLRHNGEVIGVLEYINRRGQPPYQAFTPAEMDKAAIFADALASLVNAYEAAKMFRDLGNRIISGDEEMDVNGIREWLTELRSSAEHREMMDLAVLVREIASHGEAERRLCRDVLEAFMKFSGSHGETQFLNY